MFSNDDDDDDDVEEAPIGATTNENSEASSHDAASTSGLEEQETGDPLGEVPAHSAHDPLEFFSGHSLSFDMNRDTHPFDETELSEGSGGQSVSEALNRVDGDVEIEGSPDAQDTMNAEESSNVSSQEAAAGESDGQSGTEGLEEGVQEGALNEGILERQNVLVQSIIEKVAEHPTFQNVASEQVRVSAEKIVESIQTQNIGLDESIRMVDLTLEPIFILPNDGVTPNVNDNAFRGDSESETDEVKLAALTLQAQSNASENSDNEPKNNRPHSYKCKWCHQLKKGGHVCSAIRSFDAWTDTSMTEISHLPAEILQDGVAIGEQKRDKELEVSRKEWKTRVPNQNLSLDLDLEPQEERTLAPSAKAQRQTEKERLKNKRTSEGHPKEEQEKQEADVEQPQSVMGDYAAASNADTPTAAEAFRAAGETDTPHLPGNEAETQQQPGPPNQDAIPEDPNHESAPNRDDESSDSDEDIDIYEV